MSLFRYLEVAIHTPGAISVVGSGGTGKTTLAEAIARQAATVQSLMAVDGRSNLPFAQDLMRSDDNVGANTSQLYAACSVLNVMLSYPVLSSMMYNVIEVDGEDVLFGNAIGDVAEELIDDLVKLVDKWGITKDTADIFASSKDELAAIKALVHWLENREGAGIASITTPLNLDWTWLVNLLATDLLSAESAIRLAQFIGKAATASGGYLSLVATEASSSDAGIRATAVDFVKNLWELRIGDNSRPVLVQVRASELVIALSFFSIVHVSTVSSAITDNVGATLSGGLDEGVGFFIQRVNDTVVNCGGVAIIESRDDFSTKSFDQEQKRQMLNRLGSSSKVSVMLHGRGQATVRFRRYTNVRNTNGDFIEPESIRDYTFTEAQINEFVGVSSSVDALQLEPRTDYDRMLINGLHFYQENANG